MCENQEGNVYQRHFEQPNDPLHLKATCFGVAGDVVALHGVIAPGTCTYPTRALSGYLCKRRARGGKAKQG